jgi:hypothetical protein
LNCAVNDRRGRARFLPTLSMMMDILPETPGPQISDVRQNGAGPVERRFPVSLWCLGHAPFSAYGAGFAAGCGEFCEI